MMLELTAANIVSELERLSNSAILQYEPFVRQIESGKISDIMEIERLLDGMLDFCHNKKMLVLYKRVLRKIVDNHYDVAKRHIDAYRDWYED
jgi:hypothetical protein